MYYIFQPKGLGRNRKKVRNGWVKVFKKPILDTLDWHTKDKRLV
jgi:hypothetical protein